MSHRPRKSVDDVTSTTFAAGGAGLRSWRVGRASRRGTGLELFQRGDDPLGEEVELAVLADAEQRAVRDGEAHFRDLVQALDGALHVLAVLAEVEAGLRGLLDLAVVAALGRAVLAEHLELVRRLRRVVDGDVARVRVAGHQPEGLLLARAADQDRRVRAAERLRRVQRAGQVVVLAVERRLGARPHLLADEDGLFEPLETLGGGREEQAEAAGLVLVPRRADAEDRPAA